MWPFNKKVKQDQDIEEEYNPTEPNVNDIMGKLSREQLNQIEESLLAQSEDGLGSITFSISPEYTITLKCDWDDSALTPKQYAALLYAVNSGQFTLSVAEVLRAQIEDEIDEAFITDVIVEWSKLIKTPYISPSQFFQSGGDDAGIS